MTSNRALGIIVAAPIGPPGWSVLFLRAARPRAPRHRGSVCDLHRRGAGSMRRLVLTSATRWSGRRIGLHLGAQATGHGRSHLPTIRFDRGTASAGFCSCRHDARFEKRALGRSREGTPGRATLCSRHGHRFRQEEMVLRPTSIRSRFRPSRSSTSSCQCLRPWDVKRTRAGALRSTAKPRWTRAGPWTGFARST